MKSQALLDDPRFRSYGVRSALAATMLMNEGNVKVADENKIGKPWSDDELDVIVADYFAMLDAELHGRPYVKARHNAALMEQIGRTHRSIEFKHQNISAVLEELGMPWIPGYKPKRNFQGAIFDAIERYLTWYGDALISAAEPAAPAAVDEDLVFVDPPSLGRTVQRPPKLERLVRKFDPIERDFRNRCLGEAGEAFVLETEQRCLQSRRPDLAKNVRWISKEEGDGAGYDILSYDPATGDQRLIEVKTTNGAARTPFFLTRVEHETASVEAERWRLYRVHLFAQTPRIFTIRPPLQRALYLQTETWRASFGAAR